MNKFTWIVIAVLVVAGAFYFGGKEETQTGPIKIGFIGPLTGDAASYGEAMMKSVKLAVEEINAANPKRPLEIIYEDGKCAGPNSTSAAQKLINVDKVKVIIGGMCSGETLAAAPIAESSKVILFSPISGSPDITYAGDFVFRNSPSDAASGLKMAEVAIDKNYNTVAILSENTEYSQALRRVFKDRYESLGGKIVVDEVFNTESKDLRTNITKIESQSPLAIYLVTQTPDKTEIAIRQFAEMNLDLPILSNEFINSDIVLKNIPQLVEDAIFAEPLFDQSRVKTKEFLNKYSTKYGSLFSGLSPLYLATYYDSVYLLHQIISEVGYDSNKIKKELYNVKNWDGVAGLLTLDKNGDPIFEYSLKTIKSGEVELLK